MPRRTARRPAHADPVRVGYEVRHVGKIFYGAAGPRGLGPARAGVHASDNRG